MNEMASKYNLQVFKSKTILKLTINKLNKVNESQDIFFFYLIILLI